MNVATASGLLAGAQLANVAPRTRAPPTRRLTATRSRGDVRVAQAGGSGQMSTAVAAAPAAQPDAAGERQQLAADAPDTQAGQAPAEAGGQTPAATRGAPPKPRRALRAVPGGAVRRRAQLLPTVVYDPAAAEEYFRKRPVLLASRLAKVGSYLLQFSAALVASKVDAAVLGVRPAPGTAAPELVLQQLAVKLGPTFVKLAQTLSMRPDLIGEGYAAALAQLQDNVEPFDSATAMAILQQELGAPPGEIFSAITPQPIASASLGQVYRATLASDGQEVAVKVQRPNVERTIALDVYMLRQTIGLVQRAAGIRRDLRVLADEVGRSLYEELDFRVEASNAAEFRRAHAHMPFIAVPGTMWRYTTRCVLVSEWVDGRSPSQLLAASRAPTGGDEAAREARRACRRQTLNLVRMGVQCSLAQLLVTGVMHGDPHSGNLLLRSADGRLCYLDFGLVVRVTPEHRQAMMSALVHLGLGEWERLVADMEALDLLREGTNKEQLAVDLRREFSAVMAEAEGKSARGGAPAESGSFMASVMGSMDADDDAADTAAAVVAAAAADDSHPELTSVLPLLSLTTTALSFGTLTRVLFRIAFRYKFLLPSYFPLVLRAVASLEGVALSVDPSFKLISAGMPVVLNQLLSDRRPAAQALLRELLLNADGTLRSDATTQQILQVWLAAADQAAAVAAGDAVAERSGRGGSLAASLDIADPAAQAAADPAAAADAGLDLAALLLDGRNAPLRRIAMDANPAETISRMPPAMKQQLKDLLVEALGSSAATSRLTDPSAAARAQRKRLFLLFRSSLGKVLRSPPQSVAALVAFTASVAFAVLKNRVAELVQRVRQGVAAFFSHGGNSSRAVTAAASPA